MIDCDFFFFFFFHQLNCFLLFILAFNSLCLSPSFSSSSKVGVRAICKAEAAGWGCASVATSCISWAMLTKLGVGSTFFFIVPMLIPPISSSSSTPTQPSVFTESTSLTAYWKVRRVTGVFGCRDRRCFESEERPRCDAVWTTSSRTFGGRRDDQPKDGAALHAAVGLRVLRGGSRR